MLMEVCCVTMATDGVLVNGRVTVFHIYINQRMNLLTT